MNRPESFENGGGDDLAGTETKSNFGVATGVALAAAAVVFVFCLLHSYSSSTSSETRKTMKSPGKNGKTMYRDDFEEDPKTYFRRLRKQ
ncbi:hypothetical protein QN277_029011 [Acacia crassicarpa]|uniref:Transmembrane protein n=1 Tax=Acacia crassicarpa TaxID=499986 RepID=A0AAE1J4C5_9FABA|nr:hypothetical protein QN277_029011 [Acacia crassicarpa]